MKVLEFIQSLIVPTHMVKRKKMNILISILIFVLATYLMSVPISMYLKKTYHEAFDEKFNFNAFNYVVNEKNDFTDDEKSKYNLINFEDFKNFDLGISDVEIKNAENVEKGIEYVLKSRIPVKNNEGTITDYETYYIHIVFDFTDEHVYDISENFDKIHKDQDNVFRHLLIIFHDRSFVFRTGSDIERKINSSEINYYDYCDISFNKLESMQDVSHELEDAMYPAFRLQYRIRSFIYVFLFPTIMSLLFSFILKNSGQLNGAKEYFNFAALASIPLVLLSVILSFISMAFCNVIFQYYIFIYLLFYFVSVIIINRRPRIE